MNLPGLVLNSALIIMLYFIYCMRILISLLLTIVTLPAIYSISKIWGSFNPKIIIVLYVIVGILGAYILSFINFRYFYRWSFYTSISLLVIDIISILIMGFILYIFGDLF